MLGSKFILLVSALIGSIHALDNGLALTPPMGWMSWQRFRCVIDCKEHPTDCLNEDLIKSTADRMAEDGYLEAGYEYIVIDDCWASFERDSEGRLQGNAERFPSGMKELAAYVHGKGLKFGIYGDYGNFTCGGYPGSLQYLEIDAQTWADWGVDYLKLDGCYVETEGMEEGYGEMARYLNATGRPIMFSCSFPAYKGLEANYSAAVEYCNLWRNYDDIDDSFASVKDITNWFTENQNFLTQFAGPGHWNDADMLLIGNYGLSFEQSKWQMSIWAMLTGPLLMSVDLTTISPEYAAILLNPDAIRINQDKLGIQGTVIKSENSINVWSKTILSEDETQNCTALAFASYRTDGVIYHYSYKLNDFDFITEQKYTLKNVWDSVTISADASDELVAQLKPTGVQLYIICPVA